MTDPTPDARSARLHAYHDGELSRFARWRFERRLRRSPELRRELAALSRVREWVRETHREEASPDLWDAIALRLPALDARRAEGEGAVRRPGIARLAWPGAAAATAILAAVVAFEWFQPAKAPANGIVRWLDSGWRDVLVLEASPDMTIIWVFDAPSSKRVDRGRGDGET